MKTNSYVVHPRIISSATRNWSIQDREQMENRNKGKNWRPLYLVAFAFVVILWSIPLIMSDHVLALCIIPSIGVGSFILIRDSAASFRYMQECDRKWKILRQDVLGFYEGFYIQWWNNPDLPYNEIVGQVRGFLIDIAKGVLTSVGDAQAELRKHMSDKFDEARLYLCGNFDECKGYKFFYEAAERELSIIIKYRFELHKNPDMITIHFNELPCKNTSRGYFNRSITYNDTPMFVARLMALDGIVEVLCGHEEYEIHVLKAHLFKWDTATKEAIMGILKEEVFPLRKLQEVTTPE